MESTSDTAKSTPPQIKTSGNRQGGLRTMPFIIGIAYVYDLIIDIYIYMT